MQATTTTPLFTPESFRALQQPRIKVPDTERVLDFALARFVALGLLTESDAPLYRKHCPSHPCLVLPIPPRPKPLTNEWLASRMAEVEVNGKTGQNFLDVAHLTNLIEVPDGPHLLIDVEDGWNRRNTRPSVSSENIPAEGRIPYVTSYGVFHGIVFGGLTLMSHNMDLVGSRYESGFVPNLYRYDDGAELSADRYDDAVPGWGAPSCGSRVGV